MTILAHILMDNFCAYFSSICLLMLTNNIYNKDKLLLPADKSHANKVSTAIIILNYQFLIFFVVYLSFYLKLRHSSKNAKHAQNRERKTWLNIKYR